MPRFSTSPPFLINGMDESYVPDWGVLFEDSLEEFQGSLFHDISWDAMEIAFDLEIEGDFE